MSKIASHRWSLPGFSILAAAVFITVHVTSGKWREAPNISDGEGFEKTLDTGREETGGGLNTDEGVRPFTYVPTSSPIEDNQFFVPVPTTIVLGHNIPQPGSKPSTSNGGGNDNNNDDKIPTLKWEIPLGEPTPDPALLYDPATPPFLLNKGERGEGKHGSAPPAYGQGDGSPANLKWNIPYGQPTPDPAMLIDPATPPSMKDYGDTPVQLKWDIPLGEPTPDPALLNPSNGMPVNLKWNIPLGEPTPDPALLNPSNGVPVLLKWNIPLGEPTPDPALLTPNQGSPINLKWSIPLGEPTPDPALLTPNLGSPINLKWSIPLGEPTPDPALLTPNLGSPINLSWKIPLGEPTPDPALLTPNLGSPINLSWKIPLGEPTPDPALLNPSNGKPIILKWNIPEGMPTPDPAQLESNVGNPIVLPWFAPYPRPLEFGTYSPSVPIATPMPARNTLSPTKSQATTTTTNQPTAKPSSSPQAKPLATPVTKKPTAVAALPTTIPTGKPVLTPIVTTKIPQQLPSMIPTNQPQSLPISTPSLQPTATFPVQLPTPFPQLPPVPPPTPLPVLLPLPTLLPGLPPAPLPTPPPLIPPSPQPVPPPFTPPTPLPVPPPPVPPPPVPPPPVPPPPPPTGKVEPPPPVPPPVPSSVPPPTPPTPKTPGNPTPPTETVARTPGGSSSSTVWTPGGGGPSWTSGGSSPVVPPTANVTLPVPHNQKFLKDCNPLICSLNEAADFHSMSNEDEAIYEIFYTNPIKCCRVIVEIGVGNGDRYSFSRFFEEGLKWKPLLIEANPDVFQQLRTNRPNATKINGAFCESGNLLYRNDAFSSLGGSVEVSSEIHTPLQAGSDTKEIPCLSMDGIFEEHGITKVDVMVVRLQGDALAFIRAMDWTVRVDIWVILMHGASKKERDDLVRKVLKGNEYVQAEWDIKRWCNENGQCLNNEVFLRKGFNPLPCDFYNKLTTTKITPARQLRGKI